MTSLSKIENRLDGTICRKKIVSQKSKSIIVEFCDRPCCKHLAERTLDKKCTCCGGIIRHHQNYDALMKRFDEIIQDNLGFLEGYKTWPPKSENRLYAWIKIGIWQYKIDAKYFIEYSDLAYETTSETSQEKYDRFFEGIKKDCPRIAL